MNEWKSGRIIGEVKAAPEKGVIEAEFSVFGNLDEDGDIVVKGAFAPAFENDPHPAVVYSHLWQIPPIGETLEATETETGARGKARLFLGDHEIAGQVYAGVKSGALKEWSYHYRLGEGGSEMSYSKAHGREVRYLKAFSNIFEWGPTLVGANHETSTLSVKSPLMRTLINLKFGEGELDEEALQALHDLSHQHGAKCEGVKETTTEDEDPPPDPDPDPDPERAQAVLDMRFDMPPDLLVSGRNP